ncbi:MAG: methyltransferase domain-containing protein [Ktedonobacteraceae bacterium]|nr:methyltransferase domain-containing protein [Ktedonobacteraceae bacterium]
MDHLHPTDQADGERVGAPLIEHYYDEEAHIEWQRLERHRTEFAVTMRTLTEYLPIPPQAVLDVGGGPGRYALALSSLGYQVTLLDLSQGNLTLARQKAQERQISLVQYVHGNALNLSAFPPESFDAVLLFGPLYHLLTESERQQAVREAWRVLRSDGFIFAAFITRYAAFRYLAKNSPMTLLEKHAEWEDFVRTGIYHAGQGVGFTDAYFAHPAEIGPLMEGAGFETLDLCGCEGVVAANEEQVNRLTDDAWQTWIDLNYRLSKEPSLRGAADHLLYVGRKPAM